MTEHTPTPWRADWRDIYDSNGDKICTFSEYNPQWEDDETFVRSEANASHIVRCVNSHDALVKALEDMVDNFNEEKLEWMVSAEKGAVANARAAIAAAKEEKEG